MLNLHFKVCNQILCRVRKLFRCEASTAVTKLSDTKIKFICRHSVDIGDWTNEQLARQYEVSTRRIQQLVKEYKETKVIPQLDTRRRPNSPSLTSEECCIIDQIWDETRFGARLLYHEIRRRGYHILHHKINKHLLKTHRTVRNPRKQRKRRRCRYERTHSFSLIHGDWHRTSLDHPQVIVWLDDASRYALIGAEYPEATAEHTIETFQQVIEKTWTTYHAFIKDVNTDRGTQFFSNYPNSTSQFQEFLKENKIKHIPSSRSNPQTNGKLERFWYEYDRHRWRFKTIEEFLHWYNNRLHGSLWLEIGENPTDAVIRKLEPGSLLGQFMEL